MSISDANGLGSLSRAASSNGKAKMMEFSPEEGRERREGSVTPAMGGVSSSVPQCHRPAAMMGRVLAYSWSSMNALGW